MAFGKVNFAGRFFVSKHSILEKIKGRTDFATEAISVSRLNKWQVRLLTTPGIRVCK
jgi:hypothetical protein